LIRSLFILSVLLLWPSIGHSAAVRNNLPAGGPTSGVATPEAIGALFNPALLGGIKTEAYLEGSLSFQRLQTTSFRHEGIDPNTELAYAPSQTQSTRPSSRAGLVGTKGKLGWGLFLNTPIDKAADFSQNKQEGPHTSHQRYAVIQALIQSVELSPAVGLKLHDWIQIGFSPTLSLDRFSLKNTWDTMGLEGLGPSAEEAGKLYPYTADSLFDYAGRGHHWGATVGIYSAFAPWISAGVAWTYNGKAKTSGTGTLILPDLIGAEAVPFFGASTLPLASVLRGGLRLRPHAQFEVAIGYRLESWKACCSTRKQDAVLEMTDANGNALGPENGVSVSLSKENYLPQRLKNAPAFSVGGLWSSSSQKFRLGAQASWEAAAVPDFAVNALSVDFENFGLGAFIGLQSHGFSLGLRADVRKMIAREIHSSAWDVRLVTLTDDRTFYVDERFSPSFPYTASGNGNYEALFSSMNLSLSWVPGESK
jgi:hypothetical protein